VVPKLWWCLIYGGAVFRDVVPKLWWCRIYGGAVFRNVVPNLWRCRFFLYGASEVVGPLPLAVPNLWRYRFLFGGAVVVLKSTNPQENTLAGSAS
jgi:hypothetical protein